MSAPVPTPTLGQLVDGATALLARAGVASARVDAVALAAHVLDVPQLVLAMAPDQVPDGFAARYAALVDRRCRREPLQHIVGRTGFRYLDLVVEPGVFVPRPETETVAGHAIAEAAQVAKTRPPLVVDLCCGTGAIALAVATEVPSAQVVAVDLDPHAVDLARRNAAAVGAPVDIRHGDVNDPDLLADLAATVDVVVANPPYIPPDQVPVDPEVRDHDPDAALYGGGPDGLDIPRAVLAAALRLLVPGGLIVMEHAEVQADAVRAAAEDVGLVDIRTEPDLTGRPRSLVARADP
ncbi:MAG: peptide chain release factor N(5)-glutamine methyltransferase [Micrococcales bacterium]|nr:peptide chain release factor N(5)-glutamine methyltransferase [Micrococcales bacterium]MCL2668171.1 peptide chain release factor N(5)-glutamine methyltransferase [Micrococcales bacterium]